jgi:dihydrofolate reductase
MISIIAAVADNNVIGGNNKLLWRLPADLKRFKQLTLGHPVIMGRKTFESIGKPLPGRENVVITRNPDFKAEGITIVRSLDEVLKKFSGQDVFIIGGAEIYAQSMSLADKIFLTRIYQLFEGDSFFPAIDERIWKVKREEMHEPDEKNPYRYAFIDYERIKPA